MKKNNKDKQQQAFEQALKEFYRDQFEWVAKRENIQLAHPDDPDYKWRQSYEDKFKALHTLFESLMYDYEAQLEKEETVLNKLKDEDIDDELANSMRSINEDMESFVNDMNTTLYEKRPWSRKPTIDDFDQSGKWRPVKQSFNKKQMSVRDFIKKSKEAV